MVKNKLAEDDVLQKGWLLDGYPRRQGQHEVGSSSSWLASHGKTSAPDLQCPAAACSLNHFASISFCRPFCAAASRQKPLRRRAFGQMCSCSST